MKGLQLMQIKWDDRTHLVNPKEGKKKKRIGQLENKQQDDRLEYKYVNYYIKFKWYKYPN